MYKIYDNEIKIYQFLKGGSKFKHIETNAYIYDEDLPFPFLNFESDIDFNLVKPFFGVPIVYDKFDFKMLNAIIKTLNMFQYYRLQIKSQRSYKSKFGGGSFQGSSGSDGSSFGSMDSQFSIGESYQDDPKPLSSDDKKSLIKLAIGNFKEIGLFDHYKNEFIDFETFQNNIISKNNLIGGVVDQKEVSKQEEKKPNIEKLYEIIRNISSDFTEDPKKIEEAINIIKEIEPAKLFVSFLLKNYKSNNPIVLSSSNLVTLDSSPYQAQNFQEISTTDKQKSKQIDSTGRLLKKIGPGKKRANELMDLNNSIVEKETIALQKGVTEEIEKQQVGGSNENLLEELVRNIVVHYLEGGYTLEQYYNDYKDLYNKNKDNIDSSKIYFRQKFDKLEYFSVNKRFLTKVQGGNYDQLKYMLDGGSINTIVRIPKLSEYFKSQLKFIENKLRINNKKLSENSRRDINQIIDGLDKHESNLRNKFELLKSAYLIDKDTINMQDKEQQKLMEEAKKSLNKHKRYSGVFGDLIDTLEKIANKDNEKKKPLDRFFAKE